MDLSPWSLDGGLIVGASMSGWYSIALILLLARLPCPEGQGRAIDDGGSARLTSAPGSKNLGLDGGNMGFPGSGVTVLLGMRGATLVS